MPNYGIGATIQGLLTRWESAQAARFSAWNGASSVQAGVQAVLGTAGMMLKGTAGHTAFAASTQRIFGVPTGTLAFR